MARHKAPRFIIHLAASDEPLCVTVSKSVRAAAESPVDGLKTGTVPGDDPLRTVLLEAISALRHVAEGARVDLQTNHEYLVDDMTKWPTNQQAINALTPLPPDKPQLGVKLFGGPCAGTSSLAAIPFGKLKGEHCEAELAAEFAKDLAMTNRRDALKCQIYVLDNQRRRIQQAFFGGAQTVVTDTARACCHAPTRPAQGSRPPPSRPTSPPRP